MPRHRDTSVPPAARASSAPADLLDRATTPMARLDPRGAVRWSNAALHDLVAPGSGPVTGHGLADLLERAGARSGAATPLRDLLAGQAPGSAEVPVSGAGGATRWLSVLLSPLDGPEPGWFAVCHDVSPYIREIRDHERERHHAESRGRDQALEVTMIAQDMRDPLDNILAMARLLAESGLTAAQRVYAEAIEEAAERLLAGLGGLLDGEATERGPMGREPAAFQLSLLVDGVGRLLAPRARAKDVELLATIAPETPNHLRGDAARIRQILYNLVLNALQVTTSGGVEVMVRPVEGTDAATALRFEVTDTGTGLAREELDRYLQDGGDAERPAMRRAGCGLAISRRLIGELGGAFGARSEPGRGSSFWFTVPVTPLAGSRAARASRPHGVDGLRLLVVAGDSFDMRVLADQIAQLGAKVQTLADAARCTPSLEAAQKADTPFDAVVIDGETCDGSGEALARTIRRRGRLAGLPMVLVAGPGEHRDPAALRELGIDACLTKPVTAFVLAECLRRLKGRDSPRESSPIITTRSIRRRMDGEARILLAEHDRISRVLALSALIKSGYRVDAVVDGGEVLDAARAAHYDLVALDLEMPGLDAAGTVGELCRLAGARGGMPVVALGPGDDASLRSGLLASGVAAYVAKPHAAEDLADAIRDALHKSAADARWRMVMGGGDDGRAERRGAPYGPVIRLREAIAEDDLEALQQAARTIRRRDGGG